MARENKNKRQQENTSARRVKMYAAGKMNEREKTLFSSSNAFIECKRFGFHGRVDWASAMMFVAVAVP